MTDVAWDLVSNEVQWGIPVAAGGITGNQIRDIGQALGRNRVAKTSGFTILASDRGRTFDIISGTFTIGFDAAATLGDGFHCVIANSGSGTLTLDPNGSETIDGAATATIPPGVSTVILGTGNALKLCLAGIANPATRGANTFTAAQLIAATQSDDAVGLLQAYDNRGSSASASVTARSHQGTTQLMSWVGNGSRIGNRIKTNGGLGNLYLTAGNDGVIAVGIDSGEWMLGSTGPTAGDGRLQLPTHTTKGGGIALGSDCPVFRAGAGVVAIASSLSTGEGVSTADCNIEIGERRTGSGNGYIDIHTTSGSDYELRLIRGAGANGSGSLSHKGTGSFSIITEDAATLALATNNANRFVIDSSGNYHLRGGTPATPSAFAAWTGTATRSSFATGSATLTNVAEAVKALIDDLKTIGVLP